MGVNLKDLLIRHEINLEELAGKTLAVDTFNMLFQFLTTIRTPDGNYLTDSKGRVTSHLIGLFNRTAALLQHGVKLIFVFDGVAPELKQQERQRRAGIKANAQKDYAAAEERGDTEAMKKYAVRTTTLTSSMLDDAKKLLTLLGIPFLQAPSEAEAQCAKMVIQGKAWAVASQDYDALVYGGLRVVQNLSITGRRRKIHGKGTIMIQPVLIDLQENLTMLSITHEQFIRLAMLVGTDFNYGGIKGIGPKKALALVKKYITPEELFTQTNWNSFSTTPWQKVYETMAHIPVDSNLLPKKPELDVEALQTFLIDEHDFNPERVHTTLQSLLKRPPDQKALGAYF